MPRTGDVFTDVRMAAGDLDRFIVALAEMRAVAPSPAAPTAAPSTPTPAGPPVPGAGAASEPVTGVVEAVAEQTGDITGTANVGRPPRPPVLRVA